MFSHQLKKKFSHFFTAEVGGVSPEQAVRAGLTFSAAAGALSVLAGGAHAAPCEPCSEKTCSYPGLGTWHCDIKCEAFINGTWVQVCPDETCVVFDGTHTRCEE